MLVAPALALAVGAAPAFGEALVPWWRVTSGSRPSSLPLPGGEGQIVVTAQDVGDAPADGGVAPVRIVDVLPAGLEAVAIKGIAGGSPEARNRGPVSCVLKPLSCTFSTVEVENATKEKEVVPEVLPSFEQIEVQIQVRVKPGASSGQVNSASVSGGGAEGVVSASRPILVGGPTRFGFEDFELVPEEVGGGLDRQAGSHPFQLTNVVTFNSQTPDSQKRPRTAGLPKDVVAELPAGLIGNPTPFAQCTDAQFANKLPADAAPVVANECPAASAVGVATVSVNEPKSAGYQTYVEPIFNLTPLTGEPARFGFKAAGIFPVILDAAVRAGGDYGVTITSSNITEIGWPLSAKLTFWGVPGDPRHDEQRGWECLYKFGSCLHTTHATPPPFLVMPTSCAAPFDATLRGDSWGSSEHPAEQAETVSYLLPEAIDGCNHLPFAPSIRATPDSSSASSASGLSVDVHVPQEAVLHAESLAESAVKQITVALPQGVAINPSGGDGLQACAEAEVGYRAGESGGEQLLFTPGIDEPFCPDASKVGTAEITSPLLPPGQHVKGAVYLATQNANPFGSLIAMYIVAVDPISGTIVKQAGEVHLTETGQLVTTVRDVPQLAFEDAELHFFGGERAPLATPAHCGTYTTSASFVPWSGNEPVSSTSAFQTTSGPHETPCPGASLPFAPSLTAGSTNIQAGALTAFTTTMSREDGNQDLGAVALHMPPGLSGLLSGVALCGETQANEGMCGAGSLIGETTVSAGVGSDPVTVKGGRVYITGPYHGAPFGLSIVNPVKAGPFDLENTPLEHPACDCVVVRARIEVDPHTAQLTITTDPTGPHSIPHIIEGIPVQIKHVNVVVNRPGFTFNPTNCSPLQISATITSSEGAAQPQAVPFQATNCALLKFAPVFKVSTSGKTTKANGASLNVKLSYPKAPFGGQANIAFVKVDLPKQLPSRLTTLQKACLAATFEANHSSCPPGSIVGHARVITPLLPVPLEGPAYFVSHGGQAFPSLIIVLQGYGVTVELVGSTFISKKGITSSTFKTNPDVPFNTFELTLPQGKYSALAANANLCKTKLKMPTLFIAQNGAQKRQTTRISVTGCPKHQNHERRGKAQHTHH
jgi:hypothetical protein